MRNNLQFVWLGILICLVLPLCSAYEPQYQYQDYTLIFSSNNATSCNFTNMKIPSQSIINFNKVMSQSGTDFIYTINKNNFTQLGNYCYYVSCTDGSTTQTGSECKEVTPSGKNGSSNIAFFVFIALMLYGIGILGFFGKNIPVSILGGMGMIGFGVYTINEGMIIYRDWVTNYFSYITIGLGAIFALVAVIELIQEEFA